MADDLTALLGSGDYASASLAVMTGLAVGLLIAVLWLRLFRWVFALFGAGA